MWAAVVVGVAWAGSASQELAGAHGRHPDAEVALSCAPLGRILEIAGAVPLPASVTQGASPEVAALLTLLAPGRAAEAGLDPAGAVTLAAGKGGDALVELSLPFAGGPEQAAALLTRLNPQTRAEGGAWILPSDKGEQPAALVGDRLVLGETGDTGRASTEALIDGLPDGAGCAMWVHADPPTDKVGEGPYDVALWVPLSREHPLLLRVRGPKPAPAPLAQSGGALRSGRSVATPTLVMGVGVPLDLLLDQMATLPDAPPQLAELRRNVRFGSGATLAAFGDPRNGNLAAVIPVTNARGHNLPRRKVARAIARDAGENGRNTGKGTFEVQLDQRTLYGAATRVGTVVVATSAATRDDLVRGDGTPWVSAELEALIAAWPIAVIARDANRGGAGLELGLRSRDGAWELMGYLRGLPELSGPGGGAMIGALGAMMVPAVQAGVRDAERKGVAETVEKIRQAELARLAAGQPLLALAPSPRDPAALDTKRVDWSPEGDWATLGIELPKRTRATFKVELSDGGFVVTGSVDGDGDGNPAIYVATQDLPASAATGPSVY